MTQVDTGQSATSDVQMYPIRLKTVFTVPKHFKIVNKLYPIGEAFRCQPCRAMSLLILSLTTRLEWGRAGEKSFFRASDPIFFRRMSKDPVWMMVFLLLKCVNRITWQMCWAWLDFQSLPFLHVWFQNPQSERCLAHQVWSYKYVFWPFAYQVCRKQCSFWPSAWRQFGGCISQIIMQPTQVLPSPSLPPWSWDVNETLAI